MQQLMPYSPNEEMKWKHKITEDMRLQRFLQVREQEKQHALQIRDDYHVARQYHRQERVTQAKNVWDHEMSEKLVKLTCHMERTMLCIGSAHEMAQVNIAQKSSPCYTQQQKEKEMANAEKVSQRVQKAARIWEEREQERLLPIRQSEHRDQIRHDCGQQQRYHAHRLRMEREEQEHVYQAEMKRFAEELAHPVQEAKILHFNDRVPENNVNMIPYESKQKFKTTLIKHGMVGEADVTTIRNDVEADVRDVALRMEKEKDHQEYYERQARYRGNKALKSEVAIKNAAEVEKGLKTLENYDRSRKVQRQYELSAIQKNMTQNNLGPRNEKINQYKLEAAFEETFIKEEGLEDTVDSIKDKDLPMGKRRGKKEEEEEEDVSVQNEIPLWNDVTKKSGGSRNLGKGVTKKESRTKKIVGGETFGREETPSELEDDAEWSVEEAVVFEWTDCPTMHIFGGENDSISETSSAEDKRQATSRFYTEDDFKADGMTHKDLQLDQLRRDIAKSEIEHQVEERKVFEAMKERDLLKNQAKIQKEQEKRQVYHDALKLDLMQRKVEIDSATEKMKEFGEVIRLNAQQEAMEIQQEALHIPARFNDLNDTSPSSESVSVSAAMRMLNLTDQSLDTYSQTNASSQMDEMKEQMMNQHESHGALTPMSSSSHSTIYSSQTGFSTRDDNNDRNQSSDEKMLASGRMLVNEYKAAMLSNQSSSIISSKSSSLAVSPEKVKATTRKTGDSKISPTTASIAKESKEAIEQVLREMIFSSDEEMTKSNSKVDEGTQSSTPASKSSQGEDDESGSTDAFIKRLREQALNTTDISNLSMDLSDDDSKSQQLSPEKVISSQLPRLTKGRPPLPKASLSPKGKTSSKRSPISKTEKKKKTTSSPPVPVPVPAPVPVPVPAPVPVFDAKLEMLADQRKKLQRTLEISRNFGIVEEEENSISSSTKTNESSSLYNTSDASSLFDSATDASSLQPPHETVEFLKELDNRDSAASLSFVESPKFDHGDQMRRVQETVKLLKSRGQSYEHLTVDGDDSKMDMLSDDYAVTRLTTETVQPKEKELEGMPDSEKAISAVTIIEEDSSVLQAELISKQDLSTSDILRDSEIFLAQQRTAIEKKKKELEHLLSSSTSTVSHQNTSESTTTKSKREQSLSSIDETKTEKASTSDSSSGFDNHGALFKQSVTAITSSTKSTEKDQSEVGSPVDEKATTSQDNNAKLSSLEEQLLDEDSSDVINEEKINEIAASLSSHSMLSDPEGDLSSMQLEQKKISANLEESSNKSDEDNLANLLMVSDASDSSAMMDSLDSPVVKLDVHAWRSGNKEREKSSFTNYLADIHPKVSADDTKSSLSNQNLDESESLFSIGGSLDSSVPDSLLEKDSLASSLLQTNDSLDFSQQDITNDSILVSKSDNPGVAQFTVEIKSGKMKEDADALYQNKRDEFARRSQERLANAQAKARRKSQELKLKTEERDAIKANKKATTVDKEIEKKPRPSSERLARRLSSGEVTEIPKEEARNRTSKTYNALPEVVARRKKEEDAKEKQERVKKAREKYTRKNKRGSK